MSKLRVGVIGVGHLGSLHAKMYSEIPEVQLAGVVDTDRTRAASVAAQCGTREFTSLDELLAQVDAVSIATPTSTHCAIGTMVIERGKHALIEKPLAGTVREAEQLVELSRRKHVVLQVGHIERFNPALLAIEKYNLDPMFVESHRLAQFNPRGTDVAVVLDLMIHDIDIILSLVRSPVESIVANGVAVISDHVDIANARLQFANGCVANVTASRISQKKMRKMRLFQRDAYISLDFSEGLAEVYRLVDGGDDAGGVGVTLGTIAAGSRSRSITYEQPEVKDINALKYELERFVSSALTGIEPVVTGEDGLRAIRIAHEILEKIQSQRINSI
jgi:predicted dehydrogenase